MKAFKMGDQQLAMLHFPLTNTHTTVEPRKFGRTGFVGKTFDYGKKICYAYNYAKDSCSARRCDYEHKCISCKSGTTLLTNVTENATDSVMCLLTGTPVRRLTQLPKW